MLCGSDGPTAIHRWAVNRVDWLKEFLALPHGVPSRDCIRRVLIGIRPEAFQQCVVQWITQAIHIDDAGPGRLIAIDGKTGRRSHDAGKGLGALHIVSAWASEEGVALGQVATEEKSNEITAIPQLLQQIDLAGSLITIDAMGCQKEIARDIVDGGGDFVIAVKDNQPTLRAAVEACCDRQLECDREDIRYRLIKTQEESHGRKEERSYFITKVPGDFALKKDWPWIKAIGYALRITQQADGTETSDIRYYIVSRYITAKRFGEAVRSHWGIESCTGCWTSTFGRTTVARANARWATI